MFDITDDLLDAKGQSPSYITGKKWSELFLTLAGKWGELPLYKNKEKIREFFNILENKQVMLLVSGTGSGKTVLVPKFILRYMIEKQIKGKVAVTNPKVLTTVYNAEYGAKTLDVKLGEEVGYKFKGSPKEMSDDTKTRLLYCTDGTLLARILGSDPTLSEFTGVIVDEAHERQVQIDVLLYFLKKVVESRPDFKLVIMSATINPSVFRDYFSTKKISFGELTISGKPNLPVTQYFLKTPVPRSHYVEKAVDKVVKLLAEPTDGDIIVFVATEKDAQKGCELLADQCPSSHSPKVCRETLCVEVFSRMKPDQKVLAISTDKYRSLGYHKKVLFATNVAESSITVDGLVSVIDSGYELKKYYSAKQDMDVITKAMTSHAQVLQRIGRVGRTQPGNAYHLYTKSIFEGLTKFPDPSILTSDLSKYLLSFMRSNRDEEGIGILDKLITPPHKDQVDQALKKLAKVGALLQRKKGGAMEITPLGKAMLRLSSVDIVDCVAVLLSYATECESQIIPIIVLMRACDCEVTKLFTNFKENRDSVRSFVKKHNCIHPKSEPLSVLGVYEKLYLKDNKKILRQSLWEQSQKEIEGITQQLQKRFKREYIKRILQEQFPDMKFEMPNSEERLLYCLNTAYSLCNLIVVTKGKGDVSPYRDNLKVQLSFAEPFFLNKKCQRLTAMSITSSFGKVKALGLTSL